MIVDRMIQNADAEAAQRKPPRMAAWSVGRCIRQQWLMEHGATPEPMGGRAIMRFELGDLIEEAVCRRVEATDIDFLRTDQRKTDNMEVPGLGFRCRSDFVFQCPEDLSLTNKTSLEVGDIALVAFEGDPPWKGDICGGEIKSMSDFGFSKAQRGILDEAYLAQIECGLRALDLRWWVCIAYRAETSSVCEVWVCRDDNRWDAIKRAVAIIRGDVMPARPHKLEVACDGIAKGKCVAGKTPKQGKAHADCNGTGLIPGGPYIPNWPCGWCAYKATCWGELELTFREGKPRWRVVGECRE